MTVTDIVLEESRTSHLIRCSIYADDVPERQHVFDLPTDGAVDTMNDNFKLTLSCGGVYQRRSTGEAEFAALVQCVRRHIETDLDITDLGSSDGHVHVFRDTADAPRYVVKLDTLAFCAFFFRSQLRCIRVRGQTAHYGGPASAERLMRKEVDDGTVFFEGAAGMEHIVRVVPDESSVLHFTGGRHAERLVRSDTTSAEGIQVRLFAGDSPTEYLVRIIETDGVQFLFQGVRGKERVIEQFSPASRRITYFSAAGGHVERVEHLDTGLVVVYEGPKGSETACRSFVNRRLRQQTTPDRFSTPVTQEDTVAMQGSTKRERRKASRKVRQAVVRDSAFRDEEEELATTFLTLPACLEEPPADLLKEPPADPLKEPTADPLKEPTEEQDECVVCLAALRTHALVPCGHLCLCAECVSVVTHVCPLCRVPFTSSLKIFGVPRGAGGEGSGHSQ